MRLTFAANALAAREARRRLADKLDDAGIPPALRHDALLLASELVANAIQHGSREGDEVELCCGILINRIVISVRDPARSGGAPVPRAPDHERPAGRGLQIVDRLADSWVSRTIDGRREVTFTLQVSRPPRDLAVPPERT
jgi:anti-sigma regulatory factor (Ser/Thr protein kinase)